jgi:colanic acid biosynthesis glycosyl transferase WcaI
MRVLVISQWYAPEPAFKAYPLSRDLVARGHQVTVVTGFPNYPQGRIYPGYRQRLWQWEQRDGVRVLRVPLYPSHDRSVLRRSLNYLSFALSASLIGPLLCGPADLMWVYHPPLTAGIPAWWIALLKRIPYIYGIHDMWPETVLATGMLPDGILIRWLNRLAQFIYRGADAIIVVSPGFKRNLVAKGVPEDKIRFLPNWADGNVYHPMPPDRALAKAYGLIDRFNIVYGGNIGAAQGLDNVLEAATLLQDLPVVQFVFIGDGVDKNRLEQRAQELGLANVRFLNLQPAKDMPRFYALADVLLVHLKRDPLFEITIPSKALAYLACGRPILGVVVGDAADVIREAGAGAICCQEDPAALAQAVRSLYAMPLAEREAMGRNGRQAFLASYTREKLVDQYEELFEEVTRKNRRQS